MVISACRFLIVVSVFFSCSTFSASVIEAHDFPSNEIEVRYYALIEELRCPKCLNTNLAGSDAPIAQDLRRAVFRLLVDEKFTDEAIRSYLQHRYGDFILYKPPFRRDTLMLWLAPGVFLVVGMLVLLGVLRNTSSRSLSENQQAVIREFFKD
tara:strand:- start:4283 stop:4741 length:459 start_codon:yes stop_codon:yes gene_type:complete